MRPSSTAALLAFFFGLVGLLAFDAITSSMALSAGNAYWLTLVMQMLFFGMPTLLYYRLYPLHRPSLRLASLDPGTTGLIALSALSGMLTLNNLSICWRYFLGALGLVVVSSGTSTPGTGTQLLYMLFATALAPALFEELLFRGFLLPSMERLGPRWAIFISGIMFAMLHGRIEALPSHIALGLLLSYLVLRTNSLQSAILYHAVHNISITVFAFMASVFPPLKPLPEQTLLDTFLMLPITLLLLILWGALLRAVFRHSDKQWKPSLPQTVRGRLPALSAILLSACVLLLLVIELTALLGMLPGAHL